MITCAEMTVYVPMQIGHGVLLGSNACILGPIQIGPGTKVRIHT